MMSVPDDSMKFAELRIGVDLVQISAIGASVTRFGSRFLARVFTDDEIDYCRTSPAELATRLAARFAAKEATIKILRPKDEWPVRRHIEVVRNREGWCDIVLRGPASECAQRNLVRIVSCSMSHEGDYATAVVLASVG